MNVSKYVSRRGQAAARDDARKGGGRRRGNRRWRLAVNLNSNADYERQHQQRQQSDDPASDDF